MNRCWDLSCHGRRIGQGHPGRLKLGLLVVLAALYKVHRSLLKSDIYFWFSGAPKRASRPVFNHGPYGGLWVECTTKWCNSSVTDGYSICSLARLKRMFGCRNMVIPSFGVVWCTKLSLRSVYMQWYQTMLKLGANQNAWFTWRKVPCERV